MPELTEDGGEVVNCPQVLFGIMDALDFEVCADTLDGSSPLYPGTIQMVSITQFRIQHHL